MYAYIEFIFLGFGEWINRLGDEGADGAMSPTLEFLG